MYRKPNDRKWICPIYGTICNTRGVPSYIRNKLGLKWDLEYWHNKEKLITDYQLKIENEKFIKVKKVLLDNKIKLDQSNDIIHKCTIEAYWILRYSYSIEGPSGLAKTYKIFTDLREREQERYFSRFSKSNDHGTGTDLPT